MRILIACHTLGVIGGAETYVRSVIPLLLAEGHEVAVLSASPCPPGLPPIVADPRVRTWSLQGRTAEAFGEAQAWRPDVAYSHGLLDSELDERLVGLFPTVFFVHAYYGTCLSGAKSYANRDYRPCTRRMGPMCFALYYPMRCGGLSPLTMVRTAIQSRHKLSVLGRSKRVVVASRHMAAELQNHGIRAEKIACIPLFPTDVVPDPDPPARRHRTDRVLLLGRLTPPKGVGVVAAAVAVATSRLGRALTLVVAGDGGERDTLEADVKRLGVPTQFLGWLDADRRNAELRSADALVFPSLWPEPFGLVGIEAGCLGVPAVGFGVGGSVDWLRPGVSGEVAPECTPSGLGDALVRLLSDDETWHARRRGAWGVAREFSAKRHLEALMSVFQLNTGPSA